MSNVEKSRMDATIGFENLKVRCIIGELQQERLEPQPLFFDVKVRLDIVECAESDELEDTVDYVKLAQICKDVAFQGKFQMLEACAVCLYRKILENPKIKKAWVRIRKPGGIDSALYAFVELGEL